MVLEACGDTHDLHIHSTRWQRSRFCSFRTDSCTAIITNQLDMIGCFVSISYAYALKSTLTNITLREAISNFLAG
jgi:hypothetical protein